MPRTTYRAVGSTGRGHWLKMLWNRITGAGGSLSVACGVDCPGPPWHWPQARSNTVFPCCSSAREPAIGIRQRHGALTHRVRQGANTFVGEQHALERRQIVEQPLRRRLKDLRVIGQRRQRLLLERRESCVQLIATGVVRSARPQDAVVRAGERDIVHGGNASPHVDFRLRRRQIGRRIDEPDVGRQRERDPDEAVLAKIAEIAGALAVGPEVIRVDRPEQRIVGIGIPPAPPLQELKPAPPRWLARAESCPSPYGSRRTRGHCRTIHAAFGRRTRGRRG